MARSKSGRLTPEEWAYLVQNAKNDPSRRDELLTCLRLYVLRLASSRGVTDEDEQEDLAQAVLIRVHQHLDRYDPSLSRFTSWVGTIFLRLLYNTQRDSQRRRTMLNHNAYEITEEMGVSRRLSRDRPDEVTLRKMDRERVRGAIRATLAPHLQEMLLLDMQGFSCAEIAKTLGLKEGTVKSRKHRAIAQMREVYVGK